VADEYASLENGITRFELHPTEQSFLPCHGTVCSPGRFRASFHCCANQHCPDFFISFVHIGVIQQTFFVRGPKHNDGFTLIELLVVIAIVGILSSILLPGLAQAKDKAKAIVCLNNLKQWGAAAHLFAADNQDLLPRDGSVGTKSTNNAWYIDLPRALGVPTYVELPWLTNSENMPERSIWICPANTNRGTGLNLFHYALNPGVNKTGSNSLGQVKISSIPNPNAVVWMFDTKNNTPTGSAGAVHTNLHNRGAQFVFLDGHVARFKSAEYYNFIKREAITNNPALVWDP